MQSIRGVSRISGRLSIARATPRKSTNEYKSIDKAIFT